MRHIAPAVLLIGELVLLMMLGATAHSADLETLLMPGKLAAAHAKLEGECSNCHDRADRSRQAKLCAACHKPVLEDLRAHTGYHGRLRNADGLQCRGCHQEHQGRGADIVKFVAEQFDHTKADFVLQGAHAVAACDACHAAGKPYREAPSNCSACHRKDDAHGGNLGQDCAACHDAASWLATTFDHDRTRFALRDKHREVKCAACHPANRYKNAPMQCVSCHAPDDMHRGSRGTSCADCHTTAGWKTSKFDHAREAGFALEGAHALAACTSCHRSGKFDDKLPRDCYSCHKADDAHAGRLGTQCEQCHASQQWKPARFDHKRDTKYALEGAHQNLDCHVCHTASLKEQKLATDCNSCHRAQDVHRGQLGLQCDQCHVPQGWRTDLHFDHDLTDFPLVGLHTVVPCESCHITRAYKDAKGDCLSCHKAQDKHKGSMGTACATCHSPNGWGIWDFDHAQATQFPLTGAHGKLACGDCHRKPPSEVKLPTDCYACHSNDDPHLGQFGRQCQRCHSTISFHKVRIQ